VQPKRRGTAPVETLACLTKHTVHHSPFGLSATPWSRYQVVLIGRVIKLAARVDEPMLFSPQPRAWSQPWRCSDPLSTVIGAFELLVMPCGRWPEQSPRCRRLAISSSIATDSHRIPVAASASSCDMIHPKGNGNVNDVQGDQSVAGNCVGQMQGHQHPSPARSTTSRNLGDRQFDDLHMAKAGLCMTPITGHTPIQRYRSIHVSAQQSCGTVDRGNSSCLGSNQ
jgi:hypothetical protein